MDAEIREEALQRLRNIEGHIRGIERMLADGCGCIDLLRQAIAVRRALDRVSQLLVSSHLRSCLILEASKEIPPEKEQAIEELLELLDLTGRR